MPLRPPAGFRSAFYDPLKVADAPTIGAATAGDTQASVAFTAPSNTGGAAITAYYGVSDPGQFTGTAASSPVTVTGLTNGTSYTFRVWALNSYGPSPYSAATGSVTPAKPEVGLVFAGGTNNIQKIIITTTGNATNFGTLTYAAYDGGACASSTRALFGGGEYSGTSNYNNIYYLTIDSGGSTTYFGALTQNRRSSVGLSNDTRGVWAWGYTTNVVNTIDYVTIASAGNATDFGDVGSSGMQGGAAGNTTRGLLSVFRLISGAGYSSEIFYITYSTTGNTTAFGNLTTARQNGSGVSSSTRCVFGGGFNSTMLNIIDYVTIASTGNATG